MIFLLTMFLNCNSESEWRLWGSIVLFHVAQTHFVFIPVCLIACCHYGRTCPTLSFPYSLGRAGVATGCCSVFLGQIKGGSLTTTCQWHNQKLWFWLFSHFYLLSLLIFWDTTNSSGNKGIFLLKNSAFLDGQHTKDEPGTESKYFTVSSLNCKWRGFAVVSIIFCHSPAGQGSLI